MPRLVACWFGDLPGLVSYLRLPAVLMCAAGSSEVSPSGPLTPWKWASSPSLWLSSTTFQNEAMIRTAKKFEADEGVAICLPSKRPFHLLAVLCCSPAKATLELNHFATSFEKLGVKCCEDVTFLKDEDLMKVSQGTFTQGLKPSKPACDLGLRTIRIIFRGLKAAGLSVYV